MSGDVQPRKRKDKRRKKDEALGPEEPNIQAAAPSGNEDFNIHVHNDHGTGGGICAKLVFFALLSILAVLIGMIFIEKRGITDLDIAPTESRFAKVFDGWIDESFNDHEEDDHAHAALEDHDDHEEHEDHEGSEEASVEDDHDDHDEEHENEHEEEEEQQASEEEQVSEEEQQVSDEEQQVSEEEGEEETEEQQISEEAEEETEDEQQASEEAEEEDEQAASQEQEVEDDAEGEDELVSEEQQETEEADDHDQEISDEKQASAEDEQEDEEDEDETQTLVDDAADDDDANADEDEADASNEAEADDNDDDDDNEAVDTNEDIDEKDDDDNTAEAEDDDNASNQVDDDDNAEEEAVEADDDVSRENEIVEEDSVENTAEIDDDDQEEEVVDNTAGEEDVLKEEAEKQEEVEKEEESSSMAVKFGVGVALVVVAHVVLVRKWRSGKPNIDKPIQEEEVVTDLSRRNTIVPPVPLEQIENDIQNLDEDEYSEEECEDESEEEIIIEPVPAKKSYQELQSTYSRTLPSENVSKATLENKPPQPRIVYYPRAASQDEEEEEDEEAEEDNEEVEDEEEVEEVEEGEVEEGEVEEGEGNEEDDISDVDDDELLKKLEARYGKLPSSRDNKVDEGKDDKLGSWKKIKVLPDSEESEGSEDEHWTKKDTVPADLQQKLKLAEANLRNNPDLAHKLFTNLMEQLPNNNRIKYGRAQTLDQLAEVKRSNQLLQDAISSYYDLLQSPIISDKLYLKVAERCVERIRFRGHYNRAVQVHKEVINRFPNNPAHRNQLAVTLLTSNRLTEAKPVLQEVLAKWPNDGFALAHYGFILKTKDNDMKTAVEYLRRGIESRVPGVTDGRFYFHLGDALQRLGRNDEAMKVYEDGVKHNVFLSKYQRSLYNVNRLTAKPWWPLNQSPYATFFKLLEDKWKSIREEGLALLDKAGHFKDEAENLRDTGQWKQFELFARGQKFVENCKKCPQTCSLIENFPDAKGCRRGQVKFSVMHPGTHVWPHCGPSNCRLRAHLGLKVPPKTFIRVAEETRSWHEGKIFLFDDSFEHEVWHNGSDIRLVLIVDVWHPELTAHEKRSLPAI